MEYDGFRAVDHVDARFAPGRVHAIVGQNGAGKTTLARVLAGLVDPAAGAVHVDDVRLPGGSVAAARRGGVELVHQHFALPPDFTVAECFELFNSEPRRLGGYRKARLHHRAQALLSDANVDIDPGTLVARLSVETLQAIEIARALASEPRVLVLDEPTAVLPPPAVARLFERMRMLARSGMCVIVVLHKLHEVFGVADTACVLRSGALVLPPTPTCELTPEEISRAIVGSSPVFERPEVHTVPDDAPTELAVSGLAAASDAHDAPVADVSLTIRHGEIVGIAGVEGNGQRSLVEALVGITRVRAGTVSLGGEYVTGANIGARRCLGLRVIPFERNVEGVSLSSSLWENHAVARGAREAFLIRPALLRRQCRAALDRWSVSYRSETQTSGSLSGGNVQKTILARELDGDVRLLIAAHPTRGLDIGAAKSVRTAVAAAAENGSAVLVVSADLEEMFEICHRIVVMLGGRVVAEFDRPFDIETVGAAMVGGGGS